MAMMMPVPPRKGRPEVPYKPPQKAWRGAALGAGLAAGAIVIYSATLLDTPLGTVGDLVVALVIGAILVAVSLGLFAALLALLRRVPVGLGAAVPAVILGVSVWLLLFGYPMEGALVLFLVVPPALFGGAVGLIVDRGARRWTLVFAVLAGLLLSDQVGWLAGSGSGTPPQPLQPQPGQVAPVSAPNPAEPGAYAVQTTTYGSGTDKHRPEYGAKTGIKTDPVDASPFLQGWNWRRTWYWGFDAKKAPINGRVWYPSGEGPYPLVLILHGNHAMTDFSDPGYAYLGQLLASRGYIVAAVDENFLNLSTAAGNLEGENAARAWLLLQHLETWQRWNATVGTPFYRRVDMSSIALVGHSRGGEAVYLAAALNDLPYFPDNATIPLGYHFRIRAVAALAPTDGQYKPSDKLPALTGASYLVLQGAGDSDVNRYYGARQYDRVKVTDGAFKSALYIGGANHGQFNTAWGRYDWGSLAARLINVSPLMDGAAQQQIAKVYLSAFLDAALKGDRSYLRLFEDYRAGAAWLPAAPYVSQYEDGSMRLLSNYEEDLDVLTTTAPGGAARGENLKTWKEQGIDLRPGVPEQNTAVYLGWAPGAAAVPAYSLALPDNLTRDWQLSAGKALTFALADAREPATGLAPLDLTVELVTADGTAARLPLSRWAPIPVRTAPKLYKLGPLETAIFGRPGPVFQTYTLPLADLAAGGGFDPTQVRTVRFRFDRVGAGAILLDDVGFRTLP